MLEKIEKKEIMTRGEARKKYETKFFFMVITERVDHADNDLGYVIFTADTRRELQNAPMDDYGDLCVASVIGGAAEPLSFGGLEVVHYA